jgi:hypothetical protein
VGAGNGQQHRRGRGRRHAPVAPTASGIARPIGDHRRAPAPNAPETAPQCAPATRPAATPVSQRGAHRAQTHRGADLPIGQLARNSRSAFSSGSSGSARSNAAYQAIRSHFFDSASGPRKLSVVVTSARPGDVRPVRSASVHATTSATISQTNGRIPAAGQARGLGPASTAQYALPPASAPQLFADILRGAWIE